MDLALCAKQILSQGVAFAGSWNRTNWEAQRLAQVYPPTQRNGATAHCCSHSSAIWRWRDSHPRPKYSQYNWILTRL